MGIKFSGDFAALDRFAEKLERAGEPEHLRVINRQLAEETIDLIRDGFQRSEDPDGKPWEPLKIRNGRPLDDTGGLKSSWNPRDVGVRGFSVVNGKEYAVYHQRGTGLYGPKNRRIQPTTAKALFIPGLGPRASVKGAPKRQMVPEKRRRLPNKWRIRYVETAQEVLTELFKGS